MKTWESKRIARVARKLSKEEARQRPGYAASMKKEFGRMFENTVWGPPLPYETCPDDAKIFQCDSRHVVKGDELPEEEQTDKSRFCLLGNLQFDKNGRATVTRYTKAAGQYWAPCTSLSLCRYAAAHAAICGGYLETIDLDSAYIQSNIRETNIFIMLDDDVIKYMTPEWVDAVRIAREKSASGRVLFPLIKALYGHVRSGQDFTQDLHSDLVEKGWKQSHNDPSLFSKEFLTTMGKGGRVLPEPKMVKVLLITYVDDLLVMRPPGVNEKEVWGEIMRGWKSSEQMPSRRFIGMVIQREANGVDMKFVVQQTEFLMKVIRDFKTAYNITDLKPRTTLPQPPPEPDPNYRFDAPTRARSGIGGLMYLARGSRPEICNALNILSRRCCQWDDDCDLFLKGVMQYCLGRYEGLVGINYEVPYHPDDPSVEDPSNWDLNIHSDADHRAPKSTGGVAITINFPKYGYELLIDWKSTTQKYAKLSSAESELVAAVSAAKEGMYWDDILRDTTVGKRNIPFTIHIDNAAVILASRKGWSRSLNHTKRCYQVSVQWMRDHQDEGIFNTCFVPSHRNLADGLTKIMQKCRLNDFVIPYVDDIAIIGDEATKQSQGGVRKNIEKASVANIAKSILKRLA